MKSLNIRLDDKIIEELKHVAKVMGSNVSELIREGIFKVLEDKKADPYYRLTNVEYCSPEEEKEIIESLSKLTDDDLKIVKKETVNINDYI